MAIDNDHRDLVEIPTGVCILCREPSRLLLDEHTASHVRGWLETPYATRPMIQVALPMLTPGQREQLINGSHEACFDAAFDGDDED